MQTHDAARPAGHPCWFDLLTEDVERVLGFYAAVFPWEIVDAGPELNHYRIATIDGRAAAGIGQIPPGASYAPAWLVHFASEDVAAHVRIAKDLGGEVLMEPHRVPGQGRFAIVGDPTGAQFALWEAEANVGAQVSQTPGAMAWCEVNTPDANAARTFYEVMLGADAEPMDAPGAAYWVLRQRGAPLGGVAQTTGRRRGVPPHWMPYFEVAAADAAADAAQRHGGRVGTPPFDTPFGRVAVLSDPAGAVFSVLQPPAVG